MSTNINTQTHRLFVVLDLPTTDAALIARGFAVAKAMTGNPHVPAPQPTMPVFTQTVTAYQTAHTASQQRTVGTVQARAAAKNTLVQQFERLRGCVQTAADADPDNAAAIIASAGMFVRKPRTTAPRVFAAKAGAVSGAVKLVAPRAAARASYRWQYSTDGGKTWVDLPDTLRADTAMSGLLAGATVEFRYRAVTKAGMADWSPPVSRIVT